LQLTPDGGYVMAGNTKSFGSGNLDAWLIKTDAEGNEVWNRTFGGANNDSVTSLQLTPDGGYVLAGDTGSVGSGNLDAWLIKTDAEGNEIWNRTIRTQRFSWGGYSYHGRAVQPTSDGGYILGIWELFNLEGTAAQSVKLVKFDSEGNIVNAK
ncbi:MAG TPA: hypothetical protein VLB04_09955, partial [Methanotrichaceae archaeon]|nr:hypothetical protein [Methanotrichaceae archaeon]